MSDTEPRWMSYRELSEALGISLRAAEARARRNVRAGRWSRRTDNDANKTARVLVPPTDLQAMLEAMQQDTEGDTHPPMDGGAGPHDFSALLAELKASYEQQISELRHRAEQAEATAAEALARASRLDGENEGLKHGMELMQEVMAQVRRDADEVVRRAEAVAQKSEQRMVEAEAERERLRTRGLLARLLNRT